MSYTEKDKSMEASPYKGLAKTIADEIGTDEHGIRGKENHTVRIPYEKLSEKDRQILNACGMGGYIEIKITPDFIDKWLGDA